MYFKDNTKWWDGYDPLQHVIVVWDEYAPYGEATSWSDFKRYVNWPPLMLPYKGGFLPRMFRVIVFCRNSRYGFYDRELDDPVERAVWDNRVNSIWYFEKEQITRVK